MIADDELSSEMRNLRKRLIEKDALIDSKEAQIVSLSKRCAEKANRVIELEQAYKAEFCCGNCTGHPRRIYTVCPWCGRKKSVGEILKESVEIGERREVPK